MGRADNDLEHIRSVVEEICGLAVEQDGAEFRKETIEIQRINEDADCCHSYTSSVVPSFIEQ